MGWNIAILSGLGLALFAGCGDRCDPGQEVVGGLCKAVASSTTDVVAGDEVTPTTDTIDSTDALEADAGALLTGLGDICADDSECTEAADFCMKSPFDSAGYCSVEGCSPDADDCPDGYYCLDLSVFDASLSPACARK